MSEFMGALEKISQGIIPFAPIINTTVALFGVLYGLKFNARLKREEMAREDAYKKKSMTFEEINKLSSHMQEINKIYIKNMQEVLAVLSNGAAYCDHIAANSFIRQLDQKDHLLILAKEGRGKLDAFLDNNNRWGFSDYIMRKVKLEIPFQNMWANIKIDDYGEFLLKSSSQIFFEAHLGISTCRGALQTFIVMVEQAGNDPVDFAPRLREVKAEADEIINRIRKDLDTIVELSKSIQERARRAHDSIERA